MQPARLAWNIPAVLLLVLSSGCAVRAVPASPTLTQPPVAPAATLPPQTSGSSTAIVTPSRRAATTDTAGATIPATQTITPTTAIQPTVTPSYAGTLDTLRQTPPTLMLHKNSQEFDAAAFLKDFVQILHRENRKVVTYQQISAQPDITALERGRLLIITIDDVSLQAKIDPSIQEMIDILLEADYPAVLGVVTEGKLADEETVQILKDLVDKGWEIAMHTDTHANLHQLEQVSVYGARQEIRICSDKIYQNVGVRPITLVLPYGDMVADLKILYRENVTWAVGIVRGEKYRTTNHVYYVGRESPSLDAEYTYRVMRDRFE